jgi:hypothetical protein
LSDLKSFLTSNTDARQALDQESLTSLKNNVEELKAKLRVRKDTRSGLSGSESIFDLKNNLVRLTGNLFG